MSTWSIPTQERNKFYELFGKHIDFNSNDIVKIEYKGKTLFERK